MAQEGLLIEIDRALEELCRIALSLNPPARDDLAAVARRLGDARAAYPFTGIEIDGMDTGGDFRLSAEADTACVALLQFAGIDSIPKGAYVSFSSDLADTRVLSREELASEPARQGETVARVPATSSLDEARANLIAGLAWQLERAKVLLAAAEEADAESYRDRLRLVQYHLFGGPGVAPRNR